MALCASFLLAALVELSGVTGSDLRARAYFDAHNVRVGDPLVLTVDFLGEADFQNLHPPALAKAVDRRDWKLDDASAKTDTYRDARRITYRVRPMRAGVLWFPSLAFAYAGPDGAQRTVRANAVPVHARAGRQVVVAGMGEDADAMPSPPALVTALGEASRAGVTDDVLFAWRKACAKPTAEAFAAFDFPEGRLNEATCHVRAGNWASALRIYRTLEWRIGQTPELERGIVAALALQYDNPQAELPVWRQVLRPLLRHSWLGRVSWTLGVFAAVALVFWLLGRTIRAVACVAVALMPLLTASSETVETVRTNANGAVERTRIVRDASGRVVSSSTTTSWSSSGSGGALPSGFRSLQMSDPFESFFGGRRTARKADVRIGARLVADRASVTVGEKFNLTLTLEVPRYANIAEGLNLTLEESASLRQTAQPYSLASARAANPTNVLQRIVFPMQALAPLGGPLHYAVSGRYSVGGGGFFGFADVRPFACARQTCPFSSRLPPNPPKDFSGIVSEGLVLSERCDLAAPHTNDVVTVTYAMRYVGYVPKAFLPPGAAFEWGRDEAAGQAEYRRFVVADGCPRTPRTAVVYYNPRTKRYETASVGGTALAYRPEESE